MADQTTRFTVNVQGLADLQRLAQVAHDAQKALDDLKAAQARVQSGGTLTPALLRAATGGANVGPADLGPAMAQAASAAQAKVTQATKDHADAQKVVVKQQADHNKALDQYIQMMARSTSAADRDWASQQRRNAEMQKSLSLYAQLTAAGLSVPAALGVGQQAGQPSRQSFLGVNLAAMVAGRVVAGAAGVAGGPVLGAAGAAAASGAGGLLGAVPAAVTGLGAAAIAAIAAVGAAALGVNTAQTYLRRQRQAIAGATGGTGAPTDVLRGVLQAGQGFLVDSAQNAQYAQQLGQLGVPRSQLHSALGLSYALATQTGGDIGQTAQLVGQYMGRTGASTEQAAHAMQQYAAAADAAHISTQRLLSLMQQAASAGLPSTFNVGQVAGLQRALGQNINPIGALAGPLGATGVSSLVLQNVLGVSHDRLRQMQQNPAQMLDAISQAAQRQGGGNRDVVAQLLQSEFGVDLSQFTPGQVDLLTRSRPGQFAAASAAATAAANAPTQRAAAYTAAQARVRAGLVGPIDQAGLAAQYAGLLAVLSGDSGVLGTATAAGEAAAARRLGPHITAPGALRHAIAGAGGAGATRGGPEQPITAPGALRRRIAAGGVLPGYTGSDTALAAGMTRYAADYAAASAATGVPMAVLVAQDMAESNFNPNARSAISGAQGIAQLLPSTAAGLGVRNAYDPHQAIRGQAQYDAELYKQLGSYSAVFAAYNEGPGNYQSKGVAGADQAYLDRIGAILTDLSAHGVSVDVTVRVIDAQGRTMPSTQTIKQAATTSPTAPPGQRRHH